MASAVTPLYGIPELAVLYTVHSAVRDHATVGNANTVARPNAKTKIAKILAVFIFFSFQKLLIFSHRTLCAASAAYLFFTKFRQLNVIWTFPPNRLLGVSIRTSYHNCGQINVVCQVVETTGFLKTDPHFLAKNGGVLKKLAKSYEITGLAAHYLTKKKYCGDVQKRYNLRINGGAQLATRAVSLIDK
jgi:hypothetical protein